MVLWVRVWYYGLGYGTIGKGVVLWVRVCGSMAGVDLQFFSH